MPLTAEPGSSLLPTPRASASENSTTRRTPSQMQGKHRHGLYLSSEACEIARGNAGPLLPTPNYRDEKTDLPHEGRKRWNRTHYIDRGEGDLTLPGAIALLPTPNTMDDLPPKSREQIQAHRDEGKGGDRNLREAVLYELPPGENNTRVDFGKYEPAVRLWESLLGRPAPDPTEPGKNGQRLSPRFTEWIQGLPEGWVTDTGISRKAQLRALGNGVVPQQAELALRILLKGIT